MTKKDKDLETNAYKKGIFAGIVTTYDLHREMSQRLKNSINDVMSIHFASDIISKEEQEAVQKLQYAYDTITAFQELFDSEYDEQLDELRQKALDEMPEYLSTEWPEP